MKRFTYIVAAVALTAPAGILLAQETSAASQISDAVSPLPESLRADATVITRDATSASKVLRQGSNGVICETNRPTPTAAFNVLCYAKALTAQQDFTAKLQAQGKSQQDVQAAVTAARQSGQLQPPPMGTMSYSKSGKTAADARILWVMRVPNATAESLGLPTKAGRGSPWMMLSGTAGAHVMMPQTEASLAAPPPSASKKASTE
jgi:hypothetical protein